ncbi:hypothetical protein CUZ56_01772 [Saezia sanguinis]|uniref:Uncharacterized protein n=1 Tax=Saezia sanguinis TaxID=1965230 RepID=A0A433SCM1_9BURK|nr:hypothetical protein [Saezia sanguinis]RUS66492.1 hypothetical protein CUZ56_01772 [Saezia sanguinis]
MEIFIAVFVGIFLFFLFVHFIPKPDIPTVTARNLTGEEFFRELLEKYGVPESFLNDAFITSIVNSSLKVSPVNAVISKKSEEGAYIDALDLSVRAIAEIYEKYTGVSLDSQNMLVFNAMASKMQKFGLLTKEDVKRLRE